MVELGLSVEKRSRWCFRAPRRRKLGRYRRVQQHYFVLVESPKINQEDVEALKGIHFSSFEGAHRIYKRMSLA